MSKNVFSQNKFMHHSILLFRIDVMPFKHFKVSPTSDVGVVFVYITTMKGINDDKTEYC